MAKRFESLLLQIQTLIYQTDQSHPSLEGSYLAAAVFYEVLFQKSVLTNTFMSSISSAIATFLEQAAHDVLRDSLAVWNLGKNLPRVDYSYTNTATSIYQFTSLSPSLTNVWYFGDGTSSSSTLATHNYSSTGTYSVSHLVSDGCRKDSVAKTIAVTYSTTASLVETPENELSEKSLYPNRAIN